MDIESRMGEIVFLIDISLAVCSEIDHCNEVIVTVFRLLSHFRKTDGSSNKIYDNLEQQNNKTSDVNLKWGFKFFNTFRSIARNRSRKTSFKNAKLDHLEDFERILREVFSAEREDTTKPKSKTKRVSHPSELLATALTETLHDFKWTSCDWLLSPVNHRQSNTKLSDKLSRNIFIFTKAPCSKKSLRHFSNKMVLDSDVLIDSFMSPTLLNEYQQKMKISLSCVDFTSNVCTAANQFVGDEVTTESLSILKDTFKKLGGNFMSKDMILCCVPTTSDDTHDSDSPLDPVHIFRYFPAESLLSSLQKYKQPPSEVEISAKLSCKNFLCHPVNLIKVVLKQDQGSKASLMNEMILGCKSSFLTDANGKSRDNCIPQSLVDFSDIHFTLLGCVPQSLVCDLVMTNLSHSFMLSCEDGSLVSTLLLQLASTRNTGILSMTTKGRPSLMLALLQAQNGDFGFISLLNFHATLNMEKVILQHSDSCFMEGKKLETNISQNIYDETPRLSLIEKLHSDIQKLKASVKTSSTFVRDVEESHVYRSHCMNSWHVPGSTGHMSSLISKLNDRLVTVDSKSKKNFLRQLQRHYMKERRPPELVQHTQPLASTPIYGFQRVSIGSSGGSESGSRSSHDRHLRSSTLSRGRMMVNKARNANFTATEDDNESIHSIPLSPERRRRSSSAGLIDLNLKTEDDLKSYLHRQYDQVLNAGVAMETTIRTMVSVTSQFMSKMELTNPQRSSADFINNCLTLSTAKMREKYSKQGLEDCKNIRVTEYKLQITLLLEIESLLNDTDTDHNKVLNELVSMLRALSFMSGTTYLTDFLAGIVTNYLTTLPKLLVDIFDELTLPLPPSLAKFASPASPSSLFGGQLSVINDNSFLSAPGSSQPASHLSDQSSQQAKRFQKFKQHPCIADFRQKKQILIKPKVEEKKQVKDKIKTRSSSSRAGSVDCQRAKRNLFSDKTKPAHSKTKEKSKGHHRQKHTRSKASRTLVLGTPVHKQTSQRHLLQQERRRKRENIQSEVQVIAESPVKDDDDDSGDSSALNRPARYIVREAFYSSNTQPSRNLARCLELVQKGDGQGHCSQRYVIHSSKSQGTLASAVRGESPLLSPKSRLIKTFLSSPTPKSKHKPSVTTPFRRSPRKSVKKLLFKESAKKSNINSCRPADTEYAHLIFDGENANDVDLLSSPILGSSKNSFQEGHKTPEKQVIHNQPYNPEAVSCPPVLLHTSSTDPSLNLSFRNILSSQGTKNMKMLDVSSARFSTGSSEDISTQPPTTNTPLKRVLRSTAFSSSDTTSRFPALSKNDLHVKESFVSLTKCESSSFTSFKQERKDMPCDIDQMFMPSKENKSIDYAQGKGIVTTPKKVPFSQTVNAGDGLLTPNKVKFSNFCLISPPTGSGHPPSLEKSTPGKSILKNSPIFEGKVKRRIELQSLSASLSMKHVPFVSTHVQSFASTPLSSKEKGCSRSRIDISVSTPSTSETSKTGQIYVHKLDSVSDTDKNQLNVETRYPQHCKEQDTALTCKLSITKQHDISCGSSQNSAKLQSYAMESSSSEDNSRNVFPKKTDLPAAVTICTPSSDSKPIVDSINKWARLKRSSPKNGTNSPSRLSLSPAYPSSSSDGKLKMSCSRYLRVEIKDIKNINIEQLNFSMRDKSKKRSLLFEDDRLAALSPSKRRKPEPRLCNL